MHRERRKPAWMLALRALQRLLHTLAMALHPGDACRIIRDHNDNETRCLLYTSDAADEA